MYYHNITIALKAQSQDEIDYLTCRAKFSGIDILRMGIKEALKQCPKPSKSILHKVKELVK